MDTADRSLPLGDSEHSDASHKIITGDIDFNESQMSKASLPSQKTPWVQFMLCGTSDHLKVNFNVAEQKVIRIGTVWLELKTSQWILIVTKESELVGGTTGRQVVRESLIRPL